MNRLMSAMRRISIRMRMIGTLFVVLALVCVVGASGMLTLFQQRSQADSFIAHSMQQSHLLTEIVHSVGDINRLEKDMVINYEDAITVNGKKEKWLAAVEAAKKNLSAVLAASSESEKPLATEALTRLDAYVATTKKVIGQVEDGAYDSARTADKMLAKAKDHMAGVEDMVQKIGKALDDAAAQAR